MYALVMHAEYGQSSIASYFPAYSGALIYTPAVQQ